MPNKIDLRIVVVEDDEENLYIIKQILARKGHQATCFTDGTTAWDHLVMHPLEVDIVILDKTLVEVHGLEIVNRMKNHAILKDTPVIIESGDIVPVNIKQALDSGIDRYITKPFTDKELLEIINELVSEYRIGISPELS